MPTDPASSRAAEADGLSAEDRDALALDLLLYGQSRVERSVGGRSRRVPPSEWALTDETRAEAREVE